MEETPLAIRNKTFDPNTLDVAIQFFTSGSSLGVVADNSGGGNPLFDNDTDDPQSTPSSSSFSSSSVLAAVHNDNNEDNNDDGTMQVMMEYALRCAAVASSTWTAEKKEDDATCTTAVPDNEKKKTAKKNHDDDDTTCTSCCSDHHKPRLQIKKMKRKLDECPATSDHSLEGGGDSTCTTNSSLKRCRRSTNHNEHGNEHEHGDGVLLLSTEEMELDEEDDDGNVEIEKEEEAVVSLQILALAWKKLQTLGDNNHPRMLAQYNPNCTNSNLKPNVIWKDAVFRQLKSKSKSKSMEDDSASTTISTETLVQDMRVLAHQRASRLLENSSLTSLPYRASLSLSNNLTAAEEPCATTMISNICSNMNSTNGGKGTRLQPTVSIISFGRNRNAAHPGNNKPQCLDVILDGTCIAPVGFQSRFRYALPIPPHSIVSHDPIPADTTTVDFIPKSCDHHPTPMRYVTVEYTSSIIPNTAADNENDDRNSVRYRVSANSDIIAEGNDPKQCWIQALHLRSQVDKECVYSCNSNTEDISSPSSKIITSAIAHLRRCVAVLNRIAVMPECAPFIEPHYDTDYKSIIYYPMSIQCVRKKLATFEYVSVYEFAFDVRLIFINAQVYNVVKSNEFQWATQLLSVFDHAFACWVLNTEFREYDGPWSKWRNLRVLSEDEQCQAGGFCACCLLRECDVAKPVPSRKAKKKPDKVVNRLKLISCRYCRDEFFPGCLMDAGHTIPNDPRLFVCHRCVSISEGSIGDIYSDCPYHEFYTLSPNANQFDKECGGVKDLSAEPNVSKPKVAGRGKKKKDAVAVDSMVDCEECPIVKDESTSTVTITNTKRRESSSNYTGSFWRPVTSQGDKMHGWFERVVINANSEQTSLKANKSKYKYLAPNGCVCATQADANKIAMAESDELALCYFGTSFKRRRFKNKVIANILKKSNGNVSGSAPREKEFLPLSDSLVIVKSFNALSAEVAHNIVVFPYSGMVADEIPEDGFFGLTNNGVRLRIEGLPQISALLPQDYEPVEVRHSLGLACREKLNIPSQEDELQTDALHRTYMFLFDYVSRALDGESIQRFLLPSKSAMRNKMCSVCSVLPSPDPLAMSSIHSLIPEEYLVDVIMIWEFFSKFSRFVGRSCISLADTCQALALDQSCNEVHGPSLHQLLFDEMATCLTRVLLLDFRHLAEQSESEWNEVLAALPLNVFTWPDVALRSALARSFLGRCSDQKVLNYLRKHISQDELTFSSPSAEDPNVIYQPFNPREFLVDNPDCWSTEKKINSMVYLIDEALQTRDLCHYLENLKRETSSDATSTERRNRRIYIVEPSIQFASNNLESNDDSSFQDCEVGQDRHCLDEGFAPVIQCTPISIEQSELESECTFWCQNEIVESRVDEKVGDTVCSICGLRSPFNGPFFAPCTPEKQSDIFVMIPPLTDSCNASSMLCHESCARAAFSSRFLCQLQKDDIVSRALSGRMPCSNHNFEDPHRSIPLGFDDDDNEYISVGGKRNVVFRRSPTYGWGAYAGPKKLKQLLSALSNKRNKSCREDQLMMALALRCDFNSLVGDQMDPLSKSRYNRLQTEFSKSEEQMTQLLEMERDNHGALRQQCEIWRSEMQIAIRAKIVEMRSTVYILAQGNNKLSRFRRVGDSRLRLRVSLSRYDGDEFILRHSMAQTLREIQAQTIAHRVLLREDWCCRLQHSVECNVQASLPFLFHNFDNIDAIPRVSWDLGFAEEEDGSLTDTNTNVGAKNGSTNTRGDNTCRQYVVHSVEDGELDQPPPIARFNALTNELDCIFVDIECAAKVLDVQVEQAMRQRDDNHFRFMATKLKRTITTSNSQQTLKKIHSAIKNSQLMRAQERIKSSKVGYCTKHLLNASALGYLGNGSLHGFRFEFAKFVVQQSKSDDVDIPSDGGRFAIVDDLDMDPVPVLTFSFDTAADEGANNSRVQVIPPPKNNRSMYAMYTVNNVVSSNEDLDRHIEPIPILSLALRNYRFERLKAELWNICECMPRRPIYARDQFAMHVLNLDHDAWKASLLIASTPCDLLRCMLSLVRAIPGHWLAKSFRHDGENCIRDLISSYTVAARDTNICNVAVAPIASIVYALDRAVGVNSHIYGPWQGSRCAPGVDVSVGYFSLPRHCHTPLRVAGGPPSMPRTCFNNILCTREPHHRGTCNNRALEVAEKEDFFPAMPV